MVGLFDLTLIIFFAGSTSLHEKRTKNSGGWLLIVSFGPFGKKGTLLFLKMCSFLWLG